jgi:DNA-binding LacI/PurR family transcriptional regulator
MVDTDPVEGIPALNIDDQKGAYGQMQHVLKAGHRRIAILGIRSGYRGRYERYIGTLRRRVAGYLAALEECSLNLDGRQVRLIESPCLAEGGRRAFRQVWNAEPRPTALVCMCDIVAIGAIGAARESGIRVPEDVSVIGFDDIAFSSLVSPPLTTVHQPLRPKGRLAAEMLIDHMNGKLGQSARVLRTRLVVRNSVAAPAQ